MAFVLNTMALRPNELWGPKGHPTLRALARRGLIAFDECGRGYKFVGDK